MFFWIVSLTYGSRFMLSVIAVVCTVSTLCLVNQINVRSCVGHIGFCMTSSKLEFYFFSLGVTFANPLLDFDITIEILFRWVNKLNQVVTN